MLIHNCDIVNINSITNFRGRDRMVFDKVYQLIAYGRCFSPGTPASSTTKTGCHDIAEILLKVALKHQKTINHMYMQR